MSKEFTKSYAINRIAELNEQIVEMTDNQNQTMRYLNRIRDENNQLKQQLEEKDKQIKKRVMVYEKQFIEQTDEIYSLKQQLAEKDIRIEELEGQFAYECECNKQLVELQKQLAEKDKEIEKLKQQYTILENENGKLTTELVMDKYKKAQKEVSFGKQLAIQELEKVKNFIDGRTYCADYINKRIQELKGE